MKQLTNATDQAVEPPGSPATEDPRSDRRLCAGVGEEQASQPTLGAESRQAEPGPSDSELERLTRIYRRWQKTPTHPRQTFFWKEPELTVCGRLGYPIGILSSFLLIPFSQAVMPLDLQGRIQPAITLLPFQPRFLIALALLWLVNAWVIHRYLVSRTTEESGFKPWLLKLRFLIGGVPFLGLYVIPGWRWILRKKPKWGTRKPATLPPLPEFSMAPLIADVRWLDNRFSGLRRLADQAGRRLNLKNHSMFLLLGNVIILGFLIWSPITTHPTAEERLVVGGCAIVLHVAAFAGMLCYILGEIRRARTTRFNRYVFIIYSTLWLVPIPYLALFALIFFVVIDIFIGISAQGVTLIYKISPGQKGGMGPPLWLRFEEMLRNQWGRTSGWQRLSEPGTISPSPPESTIVRHNLLQLYRAKSIVLAFDGMALAWLAMRLGDRQPGWGPAIENSLNAAAYGCLILIGLGGLVMVVYFIRIALRFLGNFAILDHHPYAQSLMASQFGLLIGISIGINLYRSDIESIGTILQAAGAFLILAGIFALVMRATFSGGERVALPNLQKFFLLLGGTLFMLCGGLIREGEAPQTYIVTLIKAFTITCPLWSIALGKRFLYWLLRPFEPRDALCSQQPAGLRWSLMFLIATLVLPLGGLVVPVWIYLRHRKWPGWERR